MIKRYFEHFKGEKTNANFLDNCKKIAIGFVLALLLIGGVKFYFSQKVVTERGQTVDNRSNTVEKIVSLDVKSLEHRTALKGEVYVENHDLPAPTNQWFSSVAFEKTSEPMFAYPLVIKMNDDGFGISYPSITSTPNTVFSSYNPDVKVIFQKSDLSASVASSDDLSVGVLQKEGDNIVSSIRITHGSPFIFASVPPKETFKISADNFDLTQGGGDNLVTFTANGKFFAFFFSPDEMSVKNLDGHNLEISVFEKEARFSIAVLPSLESVDMFQQYAFDPIVATKADFSVDGSRVDTRYEIVTQSGNDTLFALLPKSYKAFDAASGNPESFGEYQTLRGKQLLYKGKSFGFSREIASLPQQLDLSSLSDGDKETLRGFVRDDARNISITEEDTYFLGKKLFALANVLDIAEQLGMESESETVRTKLKTELEQWKNNTIAGGQQKKYFYYDPTIKGVVGETASFGSELFNDHNFHYGYFIYAASVLARYDHDYLENNAQFINLLVKDIANTDRADTTFPYIRGFDAYEGHSWAAGFGLFADGNNQESSSEAVNAWYALYLWSDVIGNENLKEEASYLYSEESSSALEYWLNIDHSDTRFQNFNHSFVSLLWGGKLDAATWFSARPEAMLGIQLIPMSPGSGYLGQDTKRVEENMTAEKALQNPTMFKDYLAMYQAFYDIVGAKQQIQALKPAEIDSANSRSFMEAWLLVLEKQSN